MSSTYYKDHLKRQQDSTPNFCENENTEQTISKNKFYSDSKQDKTCKRKLRPSLTTAIIQRTANDGVMEQQRNLLSSILNSSAANVNKTGLTNGDSEANPNVQKSDLMQTHHQRLYQVTANNSEAVMQSTNPLRKQFLRSMIHPEHYDDNIENETEVFHYANFDADSTAPMTAIPTGTKQSIRGKNKRFYENDFMFKQLENHHRDIDRVLSSQIDEDTKQQLLQEIQTKFRKFREACRKQEDSTNLKRPAKATVPGTHKYATCQKEMPRQDTTESKTEKTLPLQAVIEGPVMLRRELYKSKNKGLTPQPEIGSSASLVFQQNKQFLLPEVTALIGKSKNIQSIPQPEGHPSAHKPKSPRFNVKRKKSKSPSPGSKPRQQPPSLFTKRTFGNKYCGYCIKDELDHPPRHNHESNHDKERVLKANKASSFTPRLIRASQMLKHDDRSGAKQPGGGLKIDPKVNLFALKQQEPPQPCTMQKKQSELPKVFSNDSFDLRQNRTITQSEMDSGGALNQMSLNQQSSTPMRNSATTFTYEEYLAMQQRKFKKLYGKKLIVEDDYSVESKKSRIRSKQQNSKNESRLERFDSKLDSKDESKGTSNKHGLFNLKRPSSHLASSNQVTGTEHRPQKFIKRMPSHLSNNSNPRSEIVATNQHSVYVPVAATIREAQAHTEETSRQNQVDSGIPQSSGFTELNSQSQLKLPQVDSQSRTSQDKYNSQMTEKSQQSVVSQIGFQDGRSQYNNERQPSKERQDSTEKPVIKSIFSQKSESFYVKFNNSYHTNQASQLPDLIVCQKFLSSKDDDSLSVCTNKSPLQPLHHAINYAIKARRELEATEGAEQSSLPTEAQRIGANINSVGDKTKSFFSRQKTEPYNYRIVSGQQVLQQTDSTPRTYLVANQHVKIDEQTGRRVTTNRTLSQDSVQNDEQIRLISHSPRSLEQARYRIERERSGEMNQKSVFVWTIEHIKRSKSQESYTIHKGKKVPSSIVQAISSNSIGRYSRGKHMRINAASGSPQRDLIREHSIMRMSSKDSHELSGSGPHSRSPNGKNYEKFKLMEDLTNGRAKINSQTKILINGREVLSQKGIAGKIHKVGIGFGTGRHTQSRKAHFDDRQQQTMFILPGNYPPDVNSVGCEARPFNQSENLSAKSRNLRHVGLSPKTQTGKSVNSIGVSAKTKTCKSVRDQMDQVSQGRFSASIMDDAAQTSNMLLHNFLRRSMDNRETLTDPLYQIVQIAPVRHSKQIQTTPLVQEFNTDDPLPLTPPDEPVRTSFKSVKSQQSELVGELPFVLVMPPEESTDNEITDDWAQSGLFIVIKELTNNVRSMKAADFEAQLSQNLNPEGKRMLSLLDCDYAQALLRKSKEQTDIQQLYVDAKTTIIALTENMITPDISLGIFFKYYQEINRKNVIKLLLRCKRLYDARNQMAHILIHVVQIEKMLAPDSTLWKVLQQRAGIGTKSHTALSNRALKLLSNTLAKMSTFQQEHKLFATEFKFGRDKYADYLLNVAAIINGYLDTKKEPSFQLMENGLLLAEHDHHDKQRRAYSDWIANSQQEMGQLPCPRETEINEWLAQTEETGKTKGCGDSRVAKALIALDNKIPEAVGMNQRKAEEESKNFEPIGSEKYFQVGKTLVSEQHHDRMQLVRVRREAALLKKLERQISEEFDYEREQQKFNSKRNLGLEFGKQLQKCDNQETETVVVNFELPVEKEQTQVQNQDWNDGANSCELNVVRRGSFIRSVDQEVQSEQFFQRPKIQMRTEPLIRHEMQEKSLEDQSENAIQIATSFDISRQDLQVILPTKKPNLKQSFVQPRDSVTDKTQTIQIKGRHQKVASTPSEATDFTCYKLADGRILTEQRNSQDEQTVQATISENEEMLSASVTKD